MRRPERLETLVVDGGEASSVRLRDLPQAWRQDPVMVVVLHYRYYEDYHLHSFTVDQYGMEGRLTHYPAQRFFSARNQPLELFVAQVVDAVFEELSSLRAQKHKQVNVAKKGDPLRVEVALSRPGDWALLRKRLNNLSYIERWELKAIRSQQLTLALHSEMDIDRLYQHLQLDHLTLVSHQGQLFLEELASW